MNGMFQSIKAADLLNSNNRKLAEKVAGLWDRCVAPEEQYMERGSVILVDFGHWLNQSAWTDETGFFLKFRLAPLDRKRAGVREKGREVLRGFTKMFGQYQRTTTYDEDVLDECGEGTITVVVVTGTHMIGD